MFKKILVPLDGSNLAECALWHVNNMARQGGIGAVILFSVAEVKSPGPNSALHDIGITPGFDFQGFRKTELDKYRNYLGRVETRFRTEGIRVESVVCEGNNPAKHIADFSEESGVDLIVIATHGYTGMKRIFLGSVASKVVHESHIPVLLIRPEATEYQHLSPGLYNAMPLGRWLHS